MPSGNSFPAMPYSPSGKSAEASLKSSHFFEAVLYAAIIIGYPIFSILATLIQYENRYLSVLLGLIIVSLSLLIMVNAPNSANTIRVRIPAVSGLFFFCFYGIQCGFDFPDNWPSEVDPINYLSSLVGLCLLPYAALWLSGFPYTGIDLICQTMIWICLSLLSVIWLGFHWGLGDIAPSKILSDGRLSLPAINPITVGIISALAVIMAVNQITLKIKPVFNCLTLPVSALSMFASGSKGVIISSLISISVIALFRLPRKWSLCVFLVILAVASLPIYFNMGGEIDIIRRFYFIFEDQSTTDRTELIDAGLHQFYQSPIMGGGWLDLSELWHSPHNVIVETMSATGIIGLILFLLMISPAACSCYRVSIGKEILNIMHVLFMFYLINTTFYGVIYLSGPLWCTLPWFYGKVRRINSRDER